MQRKLNEDRKTKLFIADRILIIFYMISLFSEGIILSVYAIFVQKIGGDILDAGLLLEFFNI